MWKRVFYVLAMMLFFLLPQPAFGTGQEPPFVIKEMTPEPGSNINEKDVTFRLVFHYFSRPVERFTLELDGQDITSKMKISNQANGATVLTYEHTGGFSKGQHFLVWTVFLKDGEKTESYSIDVPFLATNLSKPDISNPFTYASQEFYKQHELQAVQYLNNLRSELGLDPVVIEPKLTMAAQAHSNFLLYNGDFGHFEKEGLPGFTGTEPGRRAAFFGYDNFSVGEVISYDNHSAELGLSSLINAPYHRELLIHPDLTEVGVGYGVPAEDEPGAVVLDGGFSEPRYAGYMITYPYAGQKEVNPSWIPAENPNPLESFGDIPEITGYPISLTMYGSEVEKLTVEEATLVDSNHQPVPFYQVDSNVEPDNNQRSVFLIPKKPLAFKETYTVTVSGHIETSDEMIPFKQIWSFTTISRPKIESVEKQKKELVVRLNLTDLPNASVSLKLGENEVASASAVQEPVVIIPAQNLVPNVAYNLEIDIEELNTKLRTKVMIDRSGHVLFGDSLATVQPLFKDISVDTPAFAEINWLAEQGYIKGYPDGTFKPDEVLKRKHAAVLFSRALSFPAPKKDAPFSDVKAGDMYAKEISQMFEQGLFIGSGGKFLPDSYFTKEQLATVLVRAFKLKPTDDSVTFLGENISDAHYSSVKILYQHGIFDDYYFDGKQKVTRGDFALYLYRCLQ